MFFPKTGEKAGCSLSPMVFKTAPGVPANAVRKDKEMGTQLGKKGLERFLSTAGITAQVRHREEAVNTAS